MNTFRQVISKRILNGLETFSGHRAINCGAKKCWSCKRDFTDLEAKAFFCPCDLKRILPVNDDVNYFEIFGLTPIYKVDKDALTQNFRQLMKKLHPDLFTQKTDEEKKYSLEQSSRVNKAYRVLLSPIARGMYLLKLANVNYESETVETHESTQEKSKILMDILELNETIDQISGPDEIADLEKKLESIIRPLKLELEVAFQRNDLKLATGIVSKMKYYHNVNERLKDLKLKYNLVSENN